MRRPIVAGNWKMHGSRAETAALIEELLARGPEAPAATCVICPPFVYLYEACRLLRDSAFSLGAQDVCADTHGAFTGEVSAAMLKDVGCEYVIVGHSERREHHGEDDALVNAKAKAAYRHGLTPILALGESLEIRETDGHVRYCTTQLDAGLAGIAPDQAAGIVIAYEPVWAIGTGLVASPGDAQEVCAALRTRLGELYSAELAAGVRILYGGSVNARNAAEIVAQPDIDGALVGGASLDGAEFATIVLAARPV